MSVSFLGLNSSFDSGALIDQLVSLETQNKITPLNTKKTNLSQESTFLSDVNTRVNTLKTSVNYKKIISGEILLAPKAVSTSNNSNNQYAQVTADNNALAQTFNLTVNKLATNSKRESTSAIKTDLTNASTNSSANFKGGATLTDGTVTINGQTRTFSNASGTIGDIETFLQGFSAISSATYNTSTGKFDLVFNSVSGNNFGSSGDTSNLLSALGLSNAVISGANVSGIQNLESAKTSSTLTSLGITGTKITVNGTDVSYTAATDTISTLVSKISNSIGAKVNAAYDSINGKLILTNEDTGSLSLTVSSDGDISALNITGAGAETLGDNAEFSISTLNNGSTLVSNSNTVTGLLSGVSLSLKATTPTTPATPVTVTIAEDSSGVKQKMDTVLQDLNRLITKLNENKDSFSRNFVNKIKDTMTTFVSSATNSFTSLIDIGLKSQLDGENKFIGYTFDSTKFADAFAENKEDFYKILYGSSDTGSIIGTLSDGSTGIITQLQAILDDYVDPNVPANGLISEMQDSITAQKKVIDDRIDRAQASIDAYEARLKKQFAQLDVTNAQLKDQQTAVANLAG